MKTQWKTLLLWICACDQRLKTFTESEVILSHTLMSLPGSVAIPSFQSSAPIISNSAPWEGPSLGGVSVIPTPLISPTCIHINDSHIKDIVIYWQLTHKRLQMSKKCNRGWIERYLWLWPLFSVYCEYHSEAAPLYVGLFFTYKVLPRQMQLLPALVNSIASASPLDGDCVLSCRIHHALRFQTKQSIIILFCWSSKRGNACTNGPIRVKHHQDHWQTRGKMSQLEVNHTSSSFPCFNSIS